MDLSGAEVGKAAAAWLGPGVGLPEPVNVHSLGALRQRGPCLLSLLVHQSLRKSLRFLSLLTALQQVTEAGCAKLKFLLHKGLAVLTATVGASGD